MSKNKVNKPVTLDQDLHDDFLKVCRIKDQDFMKRVRTLIKQDIENNKSELENLKNQKQMK